MMTCLTTLLLLGVICVSFAVFPPLGVIELVGLIVYAIVRSASKE